MSKLLAIVIIGLLLVPSAAVAQDQPLDERILLTFVPNVQFAPFYMGIEAGYFEEAGFAVSLEHLQEPEVLDLVAVGQANYGVVSGEQVILARSQDRDVVYAFEWFQQYPVGLVYDSALNLSDLGDLRGKIVGIPGRFGASYSGLTALLHNANLTEADIELTEIGFNAPEVFCLGLVDAAVVYINNEPLQIQQLADAGDCGDVQAVAVTSVASQVDLVSNGLIISRALLDDDSAAVQRLVSSFAEALRATIDNPAAAYLASLAYVESLQRDDSLLKALESAAEAQSDFLSELPSRADLAASRADLADQLKSRFDAQTLSQFIILLNTIELWDADQLGISDMASWQAMHDTLQRMGFLGASPVVLGDAFSNQFIVAAE
ncbi:MAG: ABC transporter substrate-binding protein [Chloroflexi bacterium]|nr:ABC transporter substrate-binding protein [Chloroflexota bacterium]